MLNGKAFSAKIRITFCTGIVKFMYQTLNWKEHLKNEIDLTGAKRHTQNNSQNKTDQ